MNLPDPTTRLPRETVPGLLRGHLEKAELALNNAAWCLRFRPEALPRRAVLELAAALTAVAGVHRQVRPPAPPPSSCPSRR